MKNPFKSEAKQGAPPSREALIEALSSVYDPEIAVNIYDLGLIYRLAVDDAGRVEVDMTLTAPACPVAGTLPHEVGRVIDAVPGVTDAIVRVVWQPPWSQERMSDEARFQLGLL
ncbi:MAG: DUF59 domain-containing protein [Candidatus Thiodiazotropha sp.]|nr:DUF59 domain-containing protein [Candidatus Thiodiazotropha taylori]MBT3058080.1 DUF59 domain-containing protein [Candidatus Thiodiazotropha sp. (ex Lucina pensylvanica)]MBT3062736.1 DUF59 domain-containing protein [Candidatus Thiodiazotropha sp. (ex Lucina pensylvanica)]MBV2093619.1 DUF59 domain-containing protein [Candidatus Thiodiazotropha sp. (ex Codakia orbicularis)]PUB77486.1 MAG: FeS assembly SUF system protein [gamma proteobacterium symbiont of Ctena orbiculata]